MNVKSRFISLVSLALGAAVLLPVQSGAALTGNGAATGRLSIDVVGASIPVSIRIIGPAGPVPDGYQAVVTRDRTLKGLTPGTYWIEPSPFVTPTRKPAVTASQRQLTVHAGRTATVTVAYSARRPVRAIAAGESTSCAVLRSGKVRCWGASMADGVWPTSWPMTVVRGVSNATAVAVSSRRACALRRNGTVKCWGGFYLGDGMRKASVRPVRVSGLDDAVAITAGELHVCALRDNGRVRCWGFNGKGQLGDGSNDVAKRPVGVRGITTATAVAAGGRHTCALLANGTVRCWGENSRAGNGILVDSTVPVQVQRLTNAVAVAAGGQHSCAVLRDHTAKCWGLDENGQLGIGYPYVEGEDPWWQMPQPVRDLDAATAVTGGGLHTCARLQGGALSCWGLNVYGQLGSDLGARPAADTPVPVTGIDDARTISAGVLHTCAVRSAGSVSCWGSNLSGQLGIGTTENSEVPQQVLGFGS